MTSAITNNNNNHTHPIPPQPILKSLPKNTRTEFDSYSKKIRELALIEEQEAIINYIVAHAKQRPYGIMSYGIIDIYA